LTDSARIGRIHLWSFAFSLAGSFAWFGCRWIGLLRVSFGVFFFSFFRLCLLILWLFALAFRLFLLLAALGFVVSVSFLLLLLLYLFPWSCSNFFPGGAVVILYQKGNLESSFIYGNSGRLDFWFSFDIRERAALLKKESRSGGLRVGRVVGWWEGWELAKWIQNLIWFILIDFWEFLGRTAFINVRLCRRTVFIWWQEGIHSLWLNASLNLKLSAILSVPAFFASQNQKWSRLFSLVFFCVLMARLQCRR